MQSSLKFNMLHCMKSRVRLYSTKQGTKSKNHYDTLKISPYATQTEVKSAYYKLTLQYHPDKNQSEYAKQKFQDVSEAYEVLSNHDQRKIYDRKMLLRRLPTVSTTTEEPVSYRKDIYSGSSRINNFDTWTQKYYEKQLHASRARRKMYEKRMKMEEINTHSKNNSPYPQVILIMIIIWLVAVLSWENPDVPASEKRKRKSKDEN